MSGTEPTSRAPATVFVTVKVRGPVRRWLKQEAARKGVPMYQLLEQLIARGYDEVPWGNGG